MTATAPATLLEQVRSAAQAEKFAILEMLLHEWATSPKAMPPLPIPTEPSTPVQKVYTPEEVAELRRRIATADEDSSDLQVLIDKL